MRAFALAVVLAMTSAPSLAHAAAHPSVLRLAPNKHLGPDEVVKAQLLALAHNRALGADRGIDVVYRFTSPKSRSSTGSVERFRTVIREGYGAMLDHRRATYGELQLDGTSAMQAVFLEAADGSVHAYVFVLGLQAAGANRGCWLTDAVMELQTAGHASAVQLMKKRG